MRPAPCFYLRLYDAGLPVAQWFCEVGERKADFRNQRAGIGFARDAEGGPAMALYSAWLDWIKAREKAEADLHLAMQRRTR